MTQADELKLMLCDEETHKGLELVQEGPACIMWDVLDFALTIC